MVIGGVITNWIGFFMYSHFAGKQISYSSRQQFVDLLPSLGIATAMAVPVYLMSFINISPFILFPLQLIVALGIVVGLCELTKIEEYKEVKSIVTSTLGKIKFKFKNRRHE